MVSIRKCTPKKHAFAHIEADGGDDLDSHKACDLPLQFSEALLPLSSSDGLFPLCSDAGPASSLFLFGHARRGIQRQDGMFQRVGCVDGDSVVGQSSPASLLQPWSHLAWDFRSVFLSLESHGETSLGFSMYCVFPEMTRIYFTQAPQ